MCNEKKKISVCIPCYNEEKNIPLVYEELCNVCNKMENYTFEFIFADNDSQDGSVNILRKLAAEDKRVKVIVNQKNFGPMRSQKNCTYRASGEAIIALACDLQDPPGLIPEFIKYWEAGYKLVWGQKIKSQESKIKYWMRGIYYKIVSKFSEEKQFEQVTGYGLMDRKVVDYLRYMDEPLIPARNLVPELGYEVMLIPYEQRKRENGKSSYNLKKYFNLAMHSFVYTSKVPLRMAVVSGMIIGVISFIIGFFYLAYKLLHWNSFYAGMAPLVIGMFFLGAVQLFFIGIVGEYIGSILEKMQKRPLVVEKELINFEQEDSVTSDE